MNILTLPRNDVPAILAYMQSKGGELTPEEAEMAYMLQDDPKPLLLALRRGMSGPWPTESTPVPYPPSPEPLKGASAPKRA